MDSDVDRKIFKHYEDRALESTDHGKVYATLCLAKSIESHAAMFRHLGQIGYTPDSAAISPLEKIAEAVEQIASHAENSQSS